MLAGSRSLAVDGDERNFFDQTGWANLTSHVGLPSLVVPVPQNTAGMPISLQFVGPAYSDRILLSLAEELVPLLDVAGGGSGQPGTVLDGRKAEG
ncbi:amidase family protein [Streptomyces sp. NPDC127033]|uniref:amidase family protein n=1 Tax=Streptomyces sp. NPDC127033 TaxID=3347110 RepID=UPI0036508815